MSRPLNLKWLLGVRFELFGSEIGRPGSEIHHLAGLINIICECA